MSTIESNAAEVPDPRFAAQLEWELRRAVRREARFSRPARAPRRAVIAAAVLAFAAGLSGACAAQAAWRSRDAEKLSAQHGLHVELAALRERRARADLERIQLQFEHGVAPFGELLAARTELARAVEQLQLEQLDLQEAAQTGHAPRRNLSAPLVDRRDFVLERLDAQGAALAEQLAAARTQAEQTHELARVGRATESEKRDAELAFERLGERAGLVAARRALRVRFVSGELDGAHVELLDLREGVGADGRIADRELEAARSELERARVLYEHGAIGSREHDASRDAVSALEARRRALSVELGWLEQELARRR